MSLLSNKRLQAIIGHDYLLLNLFSNGFSQKLLSQRHAQFGSDGLQGLDLEKALSTTLAAYQLDNIPLDICLMSDFVQYTVLPAQAEPLREQDLQAYAQAAFEQLFGEVAQQWQVAVQAAPPYSPTISAAIAQSIINTLDKVAERHQLKLERVSPYINAVVDEYQREIKKTTGYLAVIEQHRLVLMRLSEGRVVHIRVEVLDSDWALLLKQMLTRAQLTNTAEQQSQETVLIHAPLLQLNRSERLNNVHLQGWKVQWLLTQIYNDLTQCLAQVAA